jgi:predicted RNA methylase
MNPQAIAPLQETKNFEHDYSFVRYGNLKVAYEPALDGGGLGFGQSYIPLVDRMYGKVGRVYEFCAGPAFIGFSLLANDLCHSLCLADINPQAVRACERTVELNKLDDDVNVYESDSLDSIPRSEKWDLVVSNPPHFIDAYQDSLRHFDADWKLHDRFYSHVKAHLNEGGTLLIQENSEGSWPTDFAAMLARNGLKILDAFFFSEPNVKDYVDTYYFLRIVPVESQEIQNQIPGAVDATGTPTVIRVSGSPISSQLVYRLDIPDVLNTAHDGDRLLFYSLSHGLIPRFRRSVRIHDDGLSSPVRFCPGKYIVKNSKKKKIGTLRVEHN